LQLHTPKQALVLLLLPCKSVTHVCVLFCCASGNLSEVWIEVDRLVALLDALHGGDAAAAAVHPDESVDRDGRFLALLKEWRQQRKAAVAREIRRLHEKAGELMKGFQDWMVQHLEGGVPLDGSCAAAVTGGQQQLCSRGTHGCGQDGLS